MDKPLIEQVDQKRRGKPKGALSKNTLEFQRAYTELIETLNVDPLVVMFKLLKSRDLSVRFQAAKELLPYRYPKQASIQVQTDTPTQISFVWEDEQTQAPALNENPDTERTVN